ncbi:MAG: 50S ribosomal L9 C-terminal domain-containing protein, partial [Dehalococcoidia bacterium]
PYLQRATARAAREVKHQEGLDKDAASIAARIEGARVTITARVGEQGKLYGSVTSVHIAEEVAKLVGDEDFDHRKVLLPEAVKEVGVQPVRIRLTRNVEAAIELEVIGEGEEPGSLIAAAEAEAEAHAQAEAEVAAKAVEEATEEPDVEEAPPAEADEPEAEEVEGTASS